MQSESSSTRTTGARKGFEGSDSRSVNPSSVRSRSGVDGVLQVRSLAERTFLNRGLDVECGPSVRDAYEAEAELAPD